MFSAKFHRQLYFFMSLAFFFDAGLGALRQYSPEAAPKR